MALVGGKGRKNFQSGGALYLKLEIRSGRVQKKFKPSSGSNVFTYNLPHYTTSM